MAIKTDLLGTCLKITQDDGASTARGKVRAIITHDGCNPNVTMTVLLDHRGDIEIVQVRPSAAIEVYAHEEA